MMLKVVLDLLCLKAHHLDDYNWPYWQSALLVLCAGILNGLEPEYSALWTSPLWAVSFSVVNTCIMYLLVIYFMYLWLRVDRYGGKWCHIFNIIIAASIVELPEIGFEILGFSPLLLFPLGLYSIWVEVNALKGAFNVSMIYIIAGLILSVIFPLIIIRFLSFTVFEYFCSNGCYPFIK